MGFQHNKELASASGKKSKRGEGKITKEVKQMIIDLTNELYQDVARNKNELDTNQKAGLLMKLFEYQVSKAKKSIEIEGAVNVPPEYWITQKEWV